MIIIAESGSTKTDWVVVKDGRKISSITTTGFNPNYFPASFLESSAKKITSDIVPDGVRKIFFYGSGCSTAKSENIVKTAIGKHFPQAEISVFHDLFGAARALFGEGSGIASILGTGSSSCLLEKGEIVKAVPSLGFLLADEGSGMQIGSLLINAYFKDDLPPELHKLFETEYKLEVGTFLNDLYSQEKPNSRISSFVPFVVENRDHPFCRKLVSKAFVNFIEENIIKYPDYQKHHLGFAGSIAFLFRDILSDAANNFGLKIEKVIKNPIDELVKFHKE